MKLFIALIALVASSVSFACTNFSGTYQNTDGTTFQIGQIDCEYVNVAQTDLNLAIKTDGVLHQVAAQDIIIEGQIVGKVVVTAIAQFGATELFLNINFKVESQGQSQTYNTKSVNTLNANSDLVSVATFQDGHTETSTSHRVR